MGGFIDTHCHIAWGIDDGMDTKEHAMKSLERAKADGIVEMIATPHFVPGVYDAKKISQIHARIKEIQEIATEYDIKIHTGAELFLNSGYLDMLDEGNCPSLAGSHYLLCEFDVRKELSTRSEEIEDKLYEIKVRGFVPIIAHAERYFHKKLDVERVRNWISMGYKVQVNRTSLLGLHGDACEHNAKKLLAENMVHVIASDTHRYDGSRICLLSDAYSYVKKHYGEESANVLLIENPRRILQDKSLLTLNVQKQSIFQRLFGRS